MTDRPYRSKSTRELLSMFEIACLKIDEACLRHDTESVNNELKDVVFPIDKEIEARGAEAQRTLLPFLQNPNLFVRLHAAKSVYSAAPAEARKCLEDLQAMKYPDVSLDAGMSLYLRDNPPALD